MKFSDAMIYFGYNMASIARALNVSRQTLTNWKKQGFIPYTKQCELEVATHGKLTARREDALF